MSKEGLDPFAGWRAHARLVLLGPEARFITGQAWAVDGGMTRRMLYTDSEAAPARAGEHAPCAASRSRRILE